MTDITAPEINEVKDRQNTKPVKASVQVPASSPPVANATIQIPSSSSGELPKSNVVINAPHTELIKTPVVPDEVVKPFLVDCLVAYQGFPLTREFANKYGIPANEIQVINSFLNSNVKRTREDFEKLLENGFLILSAKDIFFALEEELALKEEELSQSSHTTADLEPKQTPPEERLKSVAEKAYLLKETDQGQSKINSEEAA